MSRLSDTAPIKIVTLAALALLWWNAAGPVAARVLPAEDAKMQTAQRVFDDLVQAIGDGRTPPLLRLVDQGRRSRLKVAWFLPGEHAITLEERAYDLCMGQGADSLDALAALLGHELAHFYQDHGWVGDFGNGFADLDVGQLLGDLQQNPAKVVELEAEADYFGGFFGYMAGYRTLQATPPLLEGIYAEYELGADMEGYPDLSERQEIARRSQAQLARLIPVFEAGERLLLVRRHQAAARCFEYIARTFPSREIHNNAGVAWLLAALEAGAGVGFVLPVEFDGETRLHRQQQTARSGSGDRQQRDQLVAAAQTAFERARTQDPQYSTAYTNLACAALVQERHPAALAYAEQALERADSPRTRAHALIARGIARAVDPGQGAAAQADFAAAQEGDHALAAVELALLQGRALPPPATDTQVVGGPPERSFGPGSPAYEALVQKPEVRIRIPISGDQREDLYLYAGPMAGGDGLIVDTGAATWSFWQVRTAAAGTSARGLGVGSHRQQVLRTYGAAGRTVAGRRVDFQVYEDDRVIFATGPGGRVERWMVFTREALFYEPTAQPPIAAAERRVALVVGNGSYASAPLRNAVNDAGDMGKALQATGFAVTVVLDADRKELRHAIRAFGQDLQAGGVGLFYYAGHGIEVGGLNYLLPVGADVAHEDEVADECVLVSSVMRKMESAGNRVNIAVLDACRNNPVARSARSGGGGLARMDAAVGSILAYATGPGQIAVDGTGANGLYTAKLLENMQIPGLKIEEVFKRVRVAVKKASQDRQVPWDSSSLTGDFYFVPAPSAEMGFAVEQAPAAGAMVHVADFGFYIDRFEVSNAQYRDFLQAMGNQLEGQVEWLDVGDDEALIEQRGGRYQVRPGFEDFPVVEVSWFGARRFCGWAGKRLPTAREWEWAALGTGGGGFPWGSEEGAGDKANFDGAADGYPSLAAVGLFPGGVGPYGAGDMAGNVWEWVDEGEGGRKLLMGGSWATDANTWRKPYWSDPSLTMEDAGFRCARDP